MEPDKLQILKARLQGYKSILEKTRPSQKSEIVSNHLARNFNEIVDELRNISPGVGEHLPKHIRTPGGRRQTDVSFLDLEIMVEQVLGILNVLESGS